MKYFVSLLLCLVTFTLYAEVPSVEKWDRFEVTLEGPKSGNPFKEVEVSAEFANEENTITVTGFYTPPWRSSLRTSWMRQNDASPGCCY